MILNISYHRYTQIYHIIDTHKYKYVLNINTKYILHTHINNNNNNQNNLSSFAHIKKKIIYIILIYLIYCTIVRYR